MSYRYRQVLEEGGALTELRAQFGLTPADLLVLTNLIKHDHPINGCFPKQSTIAYETGLHRQTVIGCLKRLEEKGVFTRSKSPYLKGGRKYPGKLYHYHFSAATDEALARAWEKKKGDMDHDYLEDTNVRTADTGNADPCPHSGHEYVLPTDTSHVRPADIGNVRTADTRSRKLEVASETEKDIRVPREADPDCDYEELSRKREQQRAERDADLRAGFKQVRQWSENKNGHHRN